MPHLIIGQLLVFGAAALAIVLALESAARELPPDLPRPLRPAEMPAASTSDLRIQVDDGSVLAIEMASRAANPDRWSTFDLPPDENPVRDLVGVLEEGRAMTIRWFQLPPVRFDLAGGRPAIAAFRARCEKTFDQTRSDAGEP